MTKRNLRQALICKITSHSFRIATYIGFYMYGVNVAAILVTGNTDRGYILWKGTTLKT